jgi:transcriptional regulator with XRE-family HTH domain
MVRRQLGAELRRLREQTGRTSAEVARELNWSDSKLSRIETAKIGLTDSDLDRLCKVYKIDTAARERLKALTRQSRQRGWWEGYKDVLLDQYEAYIAYEDEASAIHGYHSMVVPGLLQTDEYARAVTVADSASSNPAVIEQRVQVRMARQAVLSREPAPLVDVILDEAVVRRQVGGPDVMRRQLRRLVTQGQRDNISVRVLPFSVGAHRGIGGTFILLELAAEIGGPLIYCDGMTGGVIRSKPDELKSYQIAFKEISNAALSPSESAAFLTAAAG